jgi:predicted secreted protein
MKLVPYLLGVLVLGLTGAVIADDDDVRYNQVRFQVQSQQSVVNDRMDVLMGVHGEDTDPAKLANRINQDMTWALEIAKQYPSLKVSTGNYRTQPLYHKSEMRGWRADQDLKIRGQEFAAIGELIGKLQERLQVRSVAFSVTDDRRRGVEDQLTRQALEAFETKARLIADQLGFKAWRIVELGISSGGTVFRPQGQVFARVAAEAVGPPGVEGGESDLVVSVSATVELR